MDGYITAVTVDTTAIQQQSWTQHNMTPPQDAGCSLSSVGLSVYAIGPSSWERFVEGAQAFVGSALSRLRSRSRYARFGECT